MVLQSNIKYPQIHIYRYWIFALYLPNRYLGLKLYWATPTLGHLRLCWPKGVAYVIVNIHVFGIFYLKWLNLHTKVQNLHGKAGSTRKDKRSEKKIIPTHLSNSWYLSFNKFARPEAIHWRKQELKIGGGPGKGYKWVPSGQSGPMSFTSRI